MIDSKEMTVDAVSATASEVRRKPSSRKKWLRTNGFPLGLMTPALVILGAALFYPLIYTAVISLTDTSLSGQDAQWIGSENYVELLTNDRRFWPIVLHSFVWVIGSAGMQLVVGTTAALVLNQRLRARALWRGLLMVPWVTPVVVVALIWRWMFEGSDTGLVNALLINFNLAETGTTWLGDSVLVWPVLLMASIWTGSPITALLVLAGLQALPKETMEAAALDGAGAFRRFRYVVLPFIKPTLFAAAMLSLVTTWFKFELIWALTNGGPGFATSILPTYVYTLAFERFEFGQAASVAVIAMVMISILAASVAVILRERKR